MSAQVEHMLPVRVSDNPAQAKDEIALDIITRASGLLENKDAQATLLAAQFAAMSDDAQAKFFVTVARVMGSWGASAREGQIFHIGRHLATCECSTEDARSWLRNLVEAMEYKA